MTVYVGAPPSPYKGLAPFEDSDLDALLFFGRERESEVIAANLMASRITVLYGPSGVGKSSVLRAGVAHRLRREQEVEVVVFSTWTGDPVRSLIETVAGSGDSLADALGEAALSSGGDLYLILDQFEECFLYQPRGGRFAEELAEVTRRPGLRVNVLVGIREDALARLDALKAAIPNLLANRLRLDRLDRRTVILKLHGQVDRGVDREWESFVVTEDDYIEYLANSDVATAVPVGLAAKLRRSHFLFLGYTMADWNLRVILNRLWSDQPLSYRSWAVQPNAQPLEREFWRRRDVDVQELPLENYVETLAAYAGSAVPA
jgi:hypothetical protein